MKFPLDLRFKLLALSSQIYVNDASGQLIGYVKQKMFKLKEDINIFADESQTQILYNIKADRMIDFSANYQFTDASGRHLGSVKREGMKSIWKASYIVTGPNNAEVFRISEESGWTKVFDALFAEIPIAGMFTGYVFNPAYLIKDGSGQVVARLAKQPAMFEGKFNLELKANLANESEQTTLMLAVLMTTLLERHRG